MKLYSILLIASGIITFSACDKDDDKKTTYYETQDQMARPAINTVFVSAADKDMFNTTTPSAMNAAFGSKFKSRLMALNPGYTTNLLGLNADQFTGVLVTDVLNASTTAPTTFYDGTNVLTGRALADDVIDVELTLIFGGPTGASNPGLTSDKVNSNDKAFLTSFPYLANPH
jgi:PBP1b-binding outer membrane lipoprotein LpoB